MDRPASEYELFRAEHLNKLEVDTDIVHTDPTSSFLYQNNQWQSKSVKMNSVRLIEEFKVQEGSNDETGKAL
jgi:hypothetical protein